MKKIIAILIFSAALVSCSEYDNAQFKPSKDFVQLETSSVSTPEDGEEVTVDVSLGSVENPNGTSVNFDVIVNSGDESRYTIKPSSGVLEIPAGEFSGQITVTPIDNLQNDGNVNLTIELIASENLSIGVNGQDLEKTSSSVTINDNDCPTEISDSYAVEVFAFDEEAPSHSVELTPVDGSENQFNITSSWGPNFVGWATGNDANNGSFPYAGTITINEDFSVDLTGDADWATGGTGSYSACNDQFNITLSQALFGSDFTVDIVLTGQ